METQNTSGQGRSFTEIMRNSSAGMTTCVHHLPYVISNWSNRHQSSSPIHSTPSLLSIYLPIYRRISLTLCLYLRECVSVTYLKWNRNFPSVVLTKEEGIERADVSPQKRQKLESGTTTTAVLRASSPQPVYDLEGSASSLDSEPFAPSRSYVDVYKERDLNTYNAFAPWAYRHERGRLAMQLNSALIHTWKEEKEQRATEATDTDTPKR